MPNSDIGLDLPGDAPDRRCDGRGLVSLLRQFLPLKARLLAKRRDGADARRPLRCAVTQVFDAGEDMGVMCQLQWVDGESIIVAPITQLGFDRGEPAFREIAAYQRRRRARVAEEARPRARAARPLAM
jgi:hypothetical protein